MQLKAQRVASWARGKPLGPVRVELHPTNRCNLKCRFCWQTRVKKVDSSLELSDEKLLDVVREAHELGVKEWIISGGGEALVRKRITLEVMALIKKLGMWGQLTTNGVLFRERDIEWVVSIGWDQVQFSIDAPDARTHDYLRTVPGTFKRAVKAARLFSKTKAEFRTDKPYLGFNTCLCRMNYDRMADLIRLAKDVGFQLVYFEPIYPGYISRVRLTLNPDEEAELPFYAEEAKEKANELEMDTNADRFMLRAELMDKTKFEAVVLREASREEDPYISAPCYQPWYLMGIKGCGLTGCCSTFEIGIRIHEKSLREVWFSEMFNKLRREMLSRKLPHYCSKCSVVVVMDNKEIREHLRQELRPPRKKAIQGRG